MSSIFTEAEPKPRQGKGKHPVEWIWMHVKHRTDVVVVRSHIQRGAIQCNVVSLLNSECLDKQEAKR